MRSPVFHSRVFNSGVFKNIPRSGGVESEYCLWFDGVNDWVSVPNGASIQGLSQASISVWYKPIATTANNAAIYYESTTSNGFTRFGIYHQSNGTINAAARDSNAGTVFSASWTAGGSNNFGRWIHLVATYNADTNELLLYANGNLVASDISAKGAFTSGNPANSIAIGAFKSNSQSFSVNGFIDDVRLYSTALTASQVAELYSGTNVTDGRVFYLSMETGSGTTESDIDGGVVCTLTGGPTWQPQTPPRLIAGRNTEDWSVALAGGSSQYIESNSTILSATEQDFTSTIWFKANGVSTQQVLISQLDGGGTGATWLEITAGGKLQSMLGGSATTGATTITAGVWHSAAVVKDGAQVTLYLDGVLEIAAVRTTVAANGKTRLGISKSGANPFTGQIKDFRTILGGTSGSTATRLKQISRGISPSGLTHITRWRLNEGTGTDVECLDSGVHGTLTNGPPWSGDVPQHFRQAIVSSQALSCDGVDDYADLGEALDLVLPSMTVSFWFAPTNLINSSTPTYQSMVSRDASGPNAGDTQFVFLGSSDSIDAPGKLALDTDVDNVPGKRALSIATSWLQGVWHHVAGTANSTVMQLFVDGVLNGTGSRASAPWSNIAMHVNVGRRPQGDNQFAGVVDELSFYSRILSAAEVADQAAGYLVSAGLVSRYKLDGNANDSAGVNNGTEQGGVGYSTAVPGTL